MTDIAALAGSESGGAPAISAAARKESLPVRADEFPAGPGSLTLRSQRAQAEIHAIRQALELTGWVRKRAARMLAISYRSLLYKIEQYKITRQAEASAEECGMTAETRAAAKDREVA